MPRQTSLATTAHADAPANPPMAAADVFLPVLVGVWGVHGVLVPLACGIRADARDGLFAAGNAGLAGGERDVAEHTTTNGAFLERAVALA